MKLSKIFVWLLSGALIIFTILVTVSLFVFVAGIQQNPRQGFRISDLEFSNLFRISDFGFRISPPIEKSEPLTIAVVVENHEDARSHHRGLEKALLIQEHMVEGLISRFVALFSSKDLPRDVGPVRSLRSYMIVSSAPWTDVFLYGGGSPDALDQIEELGIPEFNGLYLPDHFLRDERIAEPHNLFIGKKEIGDLLKKYPVSLRSKDAGWPPYDIGPPTKTADSAHVISATFFNPLHDVTFTYEPMTDSYKRINGGIESAAHPRNVLMLETPIKSKGEYGRLNIPLKGTGSLVLFRSGRMQEGMWEKDSDDSDFRFIDQSFTPLVLSQGQTWMMLLPTLERVSWK